MAEVEHQFGDNVPTQPVPFEYEVRDVEGAPGVKWLRIKTHSTLLELFLPPQNADDLSHKLRPSRGRGKRARDEPKKKLLLPPSAEQRLITPPEKM